MNRKIIVYIHLYLAAFFAPAVLLVSVSGGLYLLGIKGDVELTSLYTGHEHIDPKADTLRADVDSLLQTAGVIDYDYEYLKVKGATLYTRPTSTQHYVIHLNKDGVEVVHARPNLQSRMIELHKGHGPTAFKTLQKIVALSLVFVIVSGFLLGVQNARLRKNTLAAAGVGTVVFMLLAL